MYCFMYPAISTMKSTTREGTALVREQLQLTPHSSPIAGDQNRVDVLRESVGAQR